MSGKLDRYINFIPKELKPSINPMLNALLSAWAGADDDIMQALEDCKAQLFVQTAEGTYLDRLASNFGVSRPVSLGLLDADFQQLIPNLSFKQKQITKAFYDTMDVFWGPLFSRANVSSTLVEPFNVSPGATFSLIVDSGATQTLTVAKGDIQNPGAATAAEMIGIFGHFTGITVTAYEDPGSSLNHLNLRTNTPGPRGNVLLTAGFDSLGFTLNVKSKITDLPQRTVLYQIKPGEVLIELPAIVPTLRRSLKGSHHFHADATLAGPQPPLNGVWQGSFLYSTTQNPFTVTSVQTSLGQTILKGSTVSEIVVADSSKFPSSGGNLIFGFGMGDQEQPVPYITVPNSNTLLISPGYSFQQTHLSGVAINMVISGQVGPYKPRADGSDLAMYLTSPANSRSVVQTILQSLSAAGIIVNFLILLPSYEYVITNPFA